jgi:rod shape-determining protein MreD
MSRNSDSLMVLLIALLLAILLTLLPMPAALEPLRPYWVGLVLIYWSMEVPKPLPLGAAFLIGLLLDVLTASLMGLHALSLLVLVYLVRRFRPRIRFVPPWQQALAVLAILVNDRIIMLWSMILMGEPVPTWQHWVSPLVGMALWPWIFLGLDHARLASRQSERN